jgi:hypothetical protein
MPGNPTECHEHALAWMQLGEGAASPETREAFLHLADSWERLAAELESAQSFLSASDQPEFEVSVSGNVIVVMDPATRFYAIFSKSSDQSRLVLERRRPTTDRALLAGAWRAANAKARELGWIASRCMSMATQNRSIQLAGSVRDCRSHVCAFFHSQEEEYQVALPFLRDGLKAGDRAVQIVNKRERTERMQRLNEAGVDVEAAESRGQLEIRTWENTYLRSGRFDQFATIALLEEVAMRGQSQGSGTTRLWANMEWALEGFPGVNDVVEYESRLNYVLPNYDMPTVCTYDVNKFSASVIVDVLRAHPLVIMGGVVRPNLFYVPPNGFLEELNYRGAPAH